MISALLAKRKKQAAMLQDAEIAVFKTARELTLAVFHDQVEHGTNRLSALAGECRIALNNLLVLHGESPSI
jgi:hypothetical protein